MAGRAHAQDLSVNTYRQKLIVIRQSVERGQLSTARQQAAALLKDRVRYGDAFVATDGTLLQRFAEEPHREEASRLLARLNVVIDELEQVVTHGGSLEKAQPNHTLLEQLQVDQAIDLIEQGGTVGGVPLEDTSLSGRIRQWFAKVKSWLRNAWRDVVDWIRDLWPDSRGSSPSGQSGTMPMVTILIIIVVLALSIGVYFVLRRSRTKSLPGKNAVSVALPPARDDDPLSRSDNEWERYAQELASAGRYREAIRAWFHAVLVTLYGAGILHYRKGRTNWEYVYSLSPQMPWRQRLIDVTQRFEKEWYGQVDSTLADHAQFSHDVKNIVQSIRTGEGRR